MSQVIAQSGEVGIQQGVILSPRAAQEIKTIIQREQLPQDVTRLRVAVKGGGCSGFGYILDLTQEPAGPNDEQLQCLGVPILIDNKSLLYLDGVEIDYKEEAMVAGFVFKNPNPTAACGCGSSIAG